ncbi:MAG: GlsB/YeaQ/YmgE family stress response membrane protein [Gemmatimonadetes bacterium]|nr:MAG: GlsB/YeaQ/YmgE family stress response membrane protein [Gemmatimonadota bacterium]
MYYLLWQIAIGILAGWLAGKIMRGKGFGVLLDLVLGVVGSLIGGLVFGLLGLHAYGLIGSIVVATAGAVMLLYLVRRL